MMIIMINLNHLKHFMIADVFLICYELCWLYYLFFIVICAYFTVFVCCALATFQDYL